MNKTMAEMDDFIHVPRPTVRVLFGGEYPKGDYSHPDRIRRGDCNNLIENRGYVDDLPLHVADNPGKYLWISVWASSEGSRPLAPTCFTSPG